MPRGNPSCVEKSNEVNIWRYGSGSGKSMGRCEAIGLSGCFCLRGGTARLENGRNEQRRAKTGGGCSSRSSAPLTFVMNLLVHRQGEFHTYTTQTSVNLHEFCTLGRGQRVVYGPLLFSCNLICTSRDLCFELFDLTLQLHLLTSPFLNFGV